MMCQQFKLQLWGEGMLTGGSYRVLTATSDLLDFSNYPTLPWCPPAQTGPGLQVLPGAVQPGKLPHCFQMPSSPLPPHFHIPIICALSHLICSFLHRFDFFTFRLCTYVFLSYLLPCLFRISKISFRLTSSGKLFWPILVGWASLLCVPLAPCDVLTSWKITTSSFSCSLLSTYPGRTWCPMKAMGTW